MRRLELDILYWSTRAFVLLLLAPFLTDTYLYQQYSLSILRDGHIPYKDFAFEYPPLALPLLVLPGLAQKALGLDGLNSFRLLFGLLLLPFDFYLFRALRARPPFPRAAFAYVMLTAFLNQLLFDRFDLLVGFLLAFPFLSGKPESWGRYSLSWGLGGALKLMPLALLPLPPLFSGLRPWGRTALYLAATALPLGLSCLAAAWVGEGKISFLSHHAGRGVQVESLVGSLTMAAQAFFGLVQSNVDTNFGAQHIGELPGLVLASRVLFLGSLAFTYFFLWFGGRGKRDVLTGAWLLVLAFVAFGYVLSPQFLLWLVPLGLCAAARLPGARRLPWLCVLGLATLLTCVHFHFYWDYVNLNRLSVAAVVARNALLVLLWALSWRWMRAPGVVSF